MNELQVYSSQLHRLDRAVADRDILWVFSRSLSYESESKEKQVKKRKAPSCMIFGKPKRRKASSSTSRAPHESGSSQATSEPSEKSEQSTSEPDYEDDAKADDESTSTSQPESEGSDVFSAEESKPGPSAPQRRKQYKRRVCTKKPSVQLEGIVPASLRVCFKSALAFLCASSSQLAVLFVLSLLHFPLQCCFVQSSLSRLAMVACTECLGKQFVQLLSLFHCIDVYSAMRIEEQRCYKGCQTGVPRPTP